MILHQKKKPLGLETQSQGKGKEKIQAARKNSQLRFLEKRKKRSWYFYFFQIKCISIAKREILNRELNISLLAIDMHLI